MGTTQQTTLINFLNSGGSLYIEGVDVGFNHNSTAFFGYLGTNYINNGTGSGINNIVGVENTFTAGDNFTFPFNTDPDYMVDVLGADEGTLYFTCQNGLGRSVYYDEGSYRIICTSSIFGVMADGESPNTKANLMARYFAFLSNDPDPHIWASADELDFGIQYLNYPATMSVNIRNSGYVDLDITSIEVTNDEFSYMGATTFSLGWGEEAEIEIVFNALSTGTFTGTLTIESNDPDQNPLLIELTAECIGSPEIEVTPTELIATVPSGEIDSDILTIYNNGESDLSFQILTTETTTDLNINISKRPARRGYSVHQVLNRDNSQSLQIYLKLVSSLRDSIMSFADDMENGINGWTTEVYGGAPDDLWHQTELNCNTPTHSWWCGIEGQGNYNTGSRINTAVISPVIDLTTIDTTVTLQFFENYETETGYDYCMVDVTTNGGTSWTQLRGSAGSGTAPSGSSGGWIATILDLTEFVENEIQIRFYFDTLDGLYNSFDGWFFDDVVIYYDGVLWLPVDPTSGIVPAGQSAQITATYDASDLEEGEYTANIIINSNDPENPEIIVPVTLTVGYVNAGNETVPVTTILIGNYPNPFNPTTTISFSTKEAGNVSINIYNMKGQLVKTLVNEYLEEDYHNIIWNGKDNSNKAVSSGIYFYKMKSGNYTATKKMILMK